MQLAVLHGRDMHQVMYNPAACAVAMQAATLGVRITSDLASALPLVQPAGPCSAFMRLTFCNPPFSSRAHALAAPPLHTGCVAPLQWLRPVHNLAREGQPLAQPHMALRQRRLALSYWHLCAMVCVVLCIHRILARSSFGRAVDTVRTRP